MQAGCRLPFSLLVSLLSLTGTACRNRDLVENELRARDLQYREALEELGKSELRTDALQREIEALRKGAAISPEQAAQTFGLKRISLGRGTGGLDDDGSPGDEALQIFLEPRDSDDHVIKAPGTLQILVLEINFQGLKTPLSSWTIEPDKLRKTWKQGLLSSGYSLVLPWKVFPQTENVRVVARLILADGRAFETDKDIKVRLVPGAPRRTDPPNSDCPLPPAVIDPFALPASHQGHSSNSVTPASHWQPVPLDDAIQLGAPVPIMPPM